MPFDDPDRTSSTLDNPEDQARLERIVVSAATRVFLIGGAHVSCDPAWHNRHLHQHRKSLTYYNLQDVEWVLATASHLLTSAQLALIQRERDFLATRAGVVEAVN